MKKKGLSFEEKQSVLLSALLEKNEFLHLKEIEKIGIKAGIISQAIKDVLQSLVDENLVKTDKIGSQNIYWILKSEDKTRRAQMFQELSNKINKLLQKKQSLEAAQQTKESSEYQLKRQQLLEDIKTLQTNISEIDEQMETLTDHDSNNIERLQIELQNASEAAMRWSDNICCLRTWLCNRLPNVSESDVNRQFSIPPELF